jgi:hypothetical protein
MKKFSEKLENENTNENPETVEKRGKRGKK